MFCLMDVSGSMDEARKDLAKRFFILLYLFLTRHYEKIDVVFIRHHTQAQEVDEDELLPRHRDRRHRGVQRADADGRDHPRALHDAASGTSTARRRRDGDNWHHDSGRCRELLDDKLLPLVRYFAYVQVADEEQNLWEEYTRAARVATRTSRCARCTQASQIYPVFRDLFKKEVA